MCRVKTISIGIVATFAAASLMALPDEAWAGQGGGHSRGARSGGGHSGSSHPGHRHIHRGYGYGATIVGGTLFYPWPYSYGFYPLSEGVEPQGPVVYVEQFTGTPTLETTDWIYCPALSASYPEVTECPGGWQRVIQNRQATDPTPAP